MSEPVIPPAPVPPPNLPAGEVPSLARSEGVDLWRDGEEGVDLRLLAAILLRRKWLILACGALAFAIAVAHLRTSVPVYKASASILWEPTNTNLVQFKGLDENPSGRTEELATQAALVNSPAVAERVLDALGGAARPAAAPAPEPSAFARARNSILGAWNALGSAIVDFRAPTSDPEEMKRQNAVAAVQGKVTVEVRKGSRIIDVFASDRDPDRAARIANEFCEQYILFLEDNRTDSFRYAVEWLTEEIEETRERLAQAERKLFDYEKSYDQNALEQKIEIAQNAMREIGAKIEEKKRELAMARTETAGADSESIKKLLLARNSNYAQLVAKLDELEVRRVELAAEHTENFPELKSVVREVETLRQQIRRVESDILREAEGQANLAGMQLESLQAQLRDQEVVVQDIRATMIEFRDLQREKEATEDVFQTLLDRSKEINVRADIQPSTVTIVSRARVPSTPDSPRAMRTVAIFLAGGLAFGTGIALLAHRLDRTVRDSRQVEQLLGLPTLGVIPFMGGRGWKRPAKGKRNPVAVLGRAADGASERMHAEAFRYLRTSIQYSTPGHPPRVILVTSSSPREGKSTIAANLAASYAARGDATLLIDADLKAPVVHETFGMHKWPGLSELLTGQPAEGAIRESDIPKLSVLTAGRPTPRPVELLESPAMAALLTELRGRFATIVVDSAPVLGMADALVLSRAADGVCVVIRRAATPIDFVHKTAVALQRMNARLLGAIYNSQERRPADLASYGYGYGYGHGYGYGYGERAYGELPGDAEGGTGSAAARASETS